jgi:thiamine biosynthesis lipoprotein
MIERNANQPLRLQKTCDAMGSTYSVVLYGQDPREMEAAIDAAFDEVERLDELLSNYKPHSEWSRVNREAGERPVRISPELFELISECLEYSRRSEGAFDISVCPLVKTWGFHKGTGRLPNSAEAAAAHLRVGYRNILLDPSAQTVYFERPGMEIDSGGIGKGYAVDRMAAVLRQRKFTTALLAASSSTIYGMGTPPGEPRGWRVTIRHPTRPKDSVAEVFLEHMSLSTSGCSEKFFTSEGRVYCHIMDPRTGQPAEGTMVAVLAPRNIDSEAWTKACFVNGRTWAAAHPMKGARVFYCDGNHEGACSWLD